MTTHQVVIVVIIAGLICVQLLYQAIVNAAGYRIIRLALERDSGLSDEEVEISARFEFGKVE
jgi:hypothetical protein